MLCPHSRCLLASLSRQHLFSEVTSALGCCSIYQEEEQQLSDSTLEVTADHSHSQAIQYHELFNEKKGQGNGLVTQRLCKYLLQQLSTPAKTESKYEWSELKGRRLFKDRTYRAKTTWIPAMVLLWRKKQIKISSTLRLIVLSPVEKGVKRLDGLHQI